MSDDIPLPKVPWPYLTSNEAFLSLLDLESQMGAQWLSWMQAKDEHAVNEAWTQAGKQG